MTPAERHFYDRGRYGEIATKVDLALLLDSRPCAGGTCDERRCPRHARTAQVVDRYLRLIGRRDTDPSDLSRFDSDLDVRPEDGP